MQDPAPEMIRKQQTLLLIVPIALAAASDGPWKDKPAAKWTEEDAKQILTDSPWARPATLTLSEQQGRGTGRGGGIGRGGIGIGLPGIGIGMPGGGMGRRGGYPGGYPGGGYPQGGTYPDDRNGRYPEGDDSRRSNEPPAVTVRWESALPVREALLQTKNSDGPTMNRSQYAIVITGVPSRLAHRPGMAEKDLKGRAELKRDGKKFAKPSDVRVLSRGGALTIVYYFPRGKEITTKDREVVFSAHLGRYELYQTYYLDDMRYNGKLEL